MRKYACKDVKNVISIFDLLIGSRYHSLVFGLTCGVPSIALSWSHKYKELFQLFDLEEFVVEYENFNEKEKIFGMIQKAWDEKIKITNTIDHKIIDIKREVDQMFDKISESLKD